MVKPLVLLFDLDGTIIGDIQWLCLEYQALRHHNKHHAPSQKIRYQTSMLYRDLQQGMIRPYFRTFFKKLQKHFSNVECFIYTASDQKWAEYIIPRIEHVLGIRFQRPLFTRRHCTLLPTGRYVKSIDTVKPLVYKALAKPYGLRHLSELNSIILIDNQPNNLKEGKGQVLCPTYDFQQPVDILRQWGSPITFPKSVLHSLGLSSNHSETSVETMFAKYYKYLASLYVKAHDVNKKERLDTYWKRLWKRFDNLHLSKLSTQEIIQHLSQV